MGDTAKRRRRISRETMALGGLITCVLLVLLVFGAQRARQGADTTLTISAGSAAGTRHVFAELLAEEARDRRLRIEITPCAGSVEALNMIIAGELDAALVQGGLDADGPVEQLAALHVEPLHLLVRPSLAEDVSRSLSALRGKTINAGREGSGTRRLALEILHFGGLIDEDYQPTHEETRLLALSYDDLLASTSPDQLPDAIFAVSSLPSPVARDLVERFGYRVAAMNYGRAFSISAVAQTDASGGVRVDPREIETMVIPRMTYDRDPAEPIRDIATLGLRLLLVCRADLPEDIGERLLETVFESRFARSSGQDVTIDLLRLPSEFTPHPAVESYLRREQPLLTGESLSILDASLNITAPMLGGVLFFWTWVRSRRRRRRVTSFRAYVRHVNAIESEALEIERSDETPIHRLVELQRDLTEMKTTALERFASGDIRDEQALSGFLALVKDTRDYITRLIAQEHELGPVPTQRAAED